MIKTKRLIMKEMQQSDFDDLCKILQDEEVMYAYEGAFSDEEVQEWLNKQIRRYKEDGIGLYAVILKETGKMIGQCGLTIQIWKNQKLVEIGYLLKKSHWHQGYAIEAASAWKEFAFDVLGESSVYSIIRDTNIASQKVAIANGMKVIDTWSKHYRNVDMPHFLYAVSK